MHGIPGQALSFLPLFLILSCPWCWKRAHISPFVLFLSSLGLAEYVLPSRSFGCGAWIFEERVVSVFDLMRRVFHGNLSGLLLAPSVYLYVLLLSARRGKMYVCLLLLFC